MQCRVAEYCKYSAIYSNNMSLNLSIDTSCTKSPLQGPSSSVRDFLQPTAVTGLYLIPQRRPLAVCNRRHARRVRDASGSNRLEPSRLLKTTLDQVALNILKIMIPMWSPGQESRRVIRENDFQRAGDRVSKLVLSNVIPHVKNKESSGTQHTICLRKRRCFVWKEHDSELAHDCVEGRVGKR